MLLSSNHKCFEKISLVATDMDGTLTRKGRFTTTLLQALEHLAGRGIKVLILTGRSAGWVSGLASYLPIVGAVAENGGLFYPANSEDVLKLTSINDYNEHRQALATAFSKLQTQFPRIQESSDNRFRLTDWTFDVADLTTQELTTLDNLCQDMGWGFTYSSVQCHIKPLGQEKAKALLQVLKQFFPEYQTEQVVTVGDSPNDESLFNKDYFPVSVGVANVLEYSQQLKYQPAYVTSAYEGEGFCELADLLLKVSQT
ncbi:MAG: HAD family hydrolase [Mastigocoleus sp. MO_167.B18]|nr:HAD family hydrolase [Mastigocoleus sp. MO_167.B18]